MKSLLNFLMLMMVFVTSGFAQSENKEDLIKEAIESKQYVFKARSMIPATGPTRQLTSEYDLTVNKDSIIAYLPYFGKAYQASIGKTSDGINFTATKFSYKVSEGKKGGWQIDVRLKDADDVRQLNLNLSKDGYGTLHINNQNRQPISYTGKVEPLTKE